MKIRYKHAPIQEAVCEIHFATDQLLSSEQLQIAGNLWKNDYPQQQIVEENNVEFHLNLGSAIMKTNPLGSRLIARSADNSKIAQQSARFMAVNQLKPYLGWSESFREDIIARLSDSVSSYHFTDVRLISLRYIDRLEFPQRPIDWSIWLAPSLPIPASVPRLGGEFQFHFHQTLDSGLVVANNLVTLPVENPNTTSLIADTTVVWQGLESVSECGRLLDKVHEPHPKLFDQLLTAKSGELLGAYNCA